MAKQLIIGTNNPGKVTELRALLLKLGYEAMTPKELGFNLEPEEDADTIEENSLMKSNFFWQHFHAPIVTDDTAFEVDALGGEPGVHTRRWIGRRMSDQEIRDELLRRLKNVPDAKRTAKLRSVLTLRIANDINFQSVGIIRGLIKKSTLPIEQPGFPIEPIFWIPTHKKFYGQFTDAERNAYGSRALAMTKLLPYLKQYIP